MHDDRGAAIVSEQPTPDGRFQSLATMQHEKSLLEMQVSALMDDFTRRYRLSPQDIEISYRVANCISIKVRV